MNRYAFNVFLEKQRNKEQVNEVAAIGRAAVSGFKAGAKQLGSAKGTSRGAAIRRVAGQAMSGDIKGAFKRSGTELAVQAKKAARSAPERIARFVSRGAASGAFNRDMQARGVGTGIQYQSAAGGLRGGASYQAQNIDPNADPLKVRRRNLSQPQPTQKKIEAEEEETGGLTPTEKQDVTGSAGPVQRRTVKTTQQAIDRSPKGKPAV